MSTTNLTPFAGPIPTAAELDELPTHAEVVASDGAVQAINTTPENDDDDMTWLAYRGSSWGWASPEQVVAALGKRAPSLNPFRARVPEPTVTAEVEPDGSLGHLLAFAEAWDPADLDATADDLTLGQYARLIRAADAAATLRARLGDYRSRIGRGTPPTGDPKPTPVDLDYEF